MRKITPVILSGGGGTRLWPLSRAHYPKQYWSMLGTKTLLQETVLRFVSKSLFLPPVILCNHEHRFLVAEQLRTINVIPSKIVLETALNNTGPAIATACLLQDDPNALLLILPADHVMQPLEALHQALLIGQSLAEQGKIVTFGIEPDRPETGYGYVEKGKILPGSDSAFTVNRFIEKPNLDTAKQLLATQQCYWNSGIFLFKASVMLTELERLHPELVEGCQSAISNANYDLDFLRLDSNTIPKTAALSIDYAVMEHTKLSVVVPMTIEWSDVGSWDALWKVSPKDASGNVVIGDSILCNVHNAYIRSERQLISVAGLENILIVATEDAILVANKSEANQIKDIVTVLKENNRKELLCHTRVSRPWGYYQTMDSGERFQVKRIVVKPGQKTSTQIHYHRSEHWVVVKGVAKVTRGDEIFFIYENQSVHLPMGIQHSVENPGKVPLHFIEVQSGAYLGEDDIIRIKDAYGRADTGNYENE